MLVIFFFAYQDHIWLLSFEAAWSKCLFRYCRTQVLWWRRSSVVFLPLHTASPLLVPNHSAFWQLALGTAVKTNYAVHTLFSFFQEIWIFLCYFKLSLIQFWNNAYISTYLLPDIIDWAVSLESIHAMTRWISYSTWKIRTPLLIVNRIRDFKLFYNFFFNMNLTRG